ncbi:Glutamate racemase [Candidatus Fokinia solitaria]|uniref:Glutamate racemase n=1 Tax=Candidatus Fokinia solitaria TaxID=1802984 RepID=A0A2U8BSP9_9RICK|nr:aspartate/glutamate racemase family protein [Candidatus Fokinia solitaria]AWD33386.1 Glutamate racemase [Candidatus Fokinia solitaria]
MKIRFFDSGLGGLSVLSSFIKQVYECYIMRYCDISYIADLEFFPYGTKHCTAIADRVNDIIYSAERQFTQLFVIACYTASFSKMTDNTITKMQIVDTLSTTKRILKKYQEHKKLFICTQLSHSINQNFLEEFDKICSIPITKEVVEYIHQNELKKAAQEIFQHLRQECTKSEKNIIFLGCTHYAILIKQLYEIFSNNGYNIAIIDPSSAIAEDVASYVTPFHNTSITRHPIKISFITHETSKEYQDEIVATCRNILQNHIPFYDDICSTFKFTFNPKL